MSSDLPIHRNILDQNDCGWGIATALHQGYFVSVAGVLDSLTRPHKVFLGEG
jgi:hypothetical protein